MEVYKIMNRMERVNRGDFFSLFYNSRTGVHPVERLI